MKLYQAFAEQGYHTTICTTFAVDFPAYEQIALNRLREAGCLNNILIADSRMASMALDDVHRPPLYAGRRYSLVGADTPRLFHPKVTLQLGVDTARLLVGSANLTASGIAGNLEVVGEVRLLPGDDTHLELFQSALGFVSQFVGPEELGALKQLDWARGHSTWLKRSAPQVEGVAFLASPEELGIARRFIDLISTEKVERLLLMSPYWDEDVTAVRYLRAALKPRSTGLLIQPDAALFPPVEHSWASLFDLGSLANSAGRFAHAKVIVAQTKRADHVLFGSPNCTFAALGSSTSPGLNVEAALYKRMDPDAAIETLELAGVLNGIALDQSSIAPYQPAAAIPLAEAAARQPGRFQLSGVQLRWVPSDAFDDPSAVIELLNAQHEVLQVAPTVVDLPRRIYEVGIAEAPCFAKVRVRDRVSAPAVVHVEEAILQNLKAVKNKKIAEALARVGIVDEENLLLYEAMELIDAEERRMEGAGGGARGRRPVPAAAATGRTLTYDEFMRGVTSAPAPDRIGGNTLASSHTNEIRALANRIIDVHERHLTLADVEALMGEIPLDRADDTADGEEAIEAGLEAPTAREPVAPSIEKLRADTEATIADAVARFHGRIAEASELRKLSTRDLLRVRLLLMIILAQGSPLLFRRPDPATGRVPALLAKGERSWPRLAGQVLFRLFGTNGYDPPLIHQVNVEVQEDGRMPTDILECLATCFWTVWALAAAVDERGAGSEVAIRAQQRAADMYSMTSLTRAELSGETVMKIMRGLDARYASRLGTHPERVLALHEQMVSSARAA